MNYCQMQKIGFDEFKTDFSYIILEKKYQQWQPSILKPRRKSAVGILRLPAI